MQVLARRVREDEKKQLDLAKVGCITAAENCLHFTTRKSKNVILCFDFQLAPCFQMRILRKYQGYNGFG